jgi:thioredoxin-dependent peroxiredoxin
MKLRKGSESMISAIAFSPRTVDDVPMSTLNVGDPAPEFSAIAHTGETVRLSELAGKNVILWFYPKADTPGWTVQGCGLRDRAPEFASKNAVILGVSFDTVEENKAFAEKFAFPYKLLSDTNRQMGMNYGAASAPDAGYAQRVAYLIGPDGTVRHVWPKADPKSFAQQALAQLWTEFGSPTTTSAFTHGTRRHFVARAARVHIGDDCPKLTEVGDGIRFNQQSWDDVRLKPNTVPISVPLRLEPNPSSRSFPNHGKILPQFARFVTTDTCASGDVRCAAMTLTPTACIDRLSNLVDTLQTLALEDRGASAAVIVRTPEAARRMAALLGRGVDVRLALEGDCKFGQGVTVTCVQEVKGLEFDYVLVPDASMAAYPDGGESRRALYVAVTRAVHHVVPATVGSFSPVLGTSAR